MLCNFTPDKGQLEYLPLKKPSPQIFLGSFLVEFFSNFLVFKTFLALFLAFPALFSSFPSLFSSFPALFYSLLPWTGFSTVLQFLSALALQCSLPSLIGFTFKVLGKLPCCLSLNMEAI